MAASFYNVSRLSRPTNIGFVAPTYLCNMKVKQKRNDMRTEKYIQVEAIVAKYENLASNTEEIKKLWGKFKEGIITSEERERLDFLEHLIGYIAPFSPTKPAKQQVVECYASAARYYINGLLMKEEEAFLAEHFEVFLDYVLAKQKVTQTGSFQHNFSAPTEWESLIPNLVEHKSGIKVFIPNSLGGREFMGLGPCDLVVDAGFKEAVLRAYVCGCNIQWYDFKSENLLWEDIMGGSFDLVIANWSSEGFADEEVSVKDVFDACNRIVREGGEIMLSLSRTDVLAGKIKSLYEPILRERTLKSQILLPSGNILLHFVKRPHDSIMICDAATLVHRDGTKGVNVDAFKSAIEASISGESSLVHRISYDSLEEKSLLPFYYINLSMGTIPLEQVAETASESVLSDECLTDERLVTVNHLSKTFSKAEFHTDSLPFVRTDRVRPYYRIQGPAVIVAISTTEVAVGYTAESASFLVPRNLYVLKPVDQLDVRYLACRILDWSFQSQMLRLVYNIGRRSALTSSWAGLLRLELPTLDEQQRFVQEVMLRGFANQENDMVMRELSFRHSIRLRKHALSQNVSAFDSLFRSLEYCMQEHQGCLHAENRLSPVCSITVGEAMEMLRIRLRTICERVAQFSDDQDWGTCEVIEPQQFIEAYEREHRVPDFKFWNLWDGREPYAYYRSNYFEEDVFDEETGKLIFHKGESLNAAWFPRKALQQVLDNVVANAREHGFTDKSRTDYVIQTSWWTDGLNMIIEVKNNGEPMPEDLDTDLVLEYGYSSVLNQRGHGGIGGGQISELMRRYGGDVRVVSSPKEEFTVTYLLTMPLASLY